MQQPCDQAIALRLADTDVALSAGDMQLSCAVSFPLGTEPYGEIDETLNLAERMVACLGAWAGSVAFRLTPPSGLFFASDGRLTNDGSLFLNDPQ